jgi:hypothetical protein
MYWGELMESLYIKNSNLKQTINHKTFASAMDVASDFNNSVEAIYLEYVL